MILGAASVGGDDRRLSRLRSWALWSLHRAALAYILTVELLAVLGVLALVARERVGGQQLIYGAVLVGLSVSYGVIADRVERLRQFLGSDQVWSDRESVWTFAAVLVLPIGWAGLVVIALYGVTLLRGVRHRTVRPHRHIFTASTVLLGSAASGFVYHELAGTAGWMTATRAAAVGVALLVYTLSNLVIMLLGIYLASRPSSLRVLLPARDEAAAELAALVLGAVTAALLVQAPWFTPAVLVLFAVLHRSSLVKQLQVAASLDSKTGLLNAAAWHELASRHLAQAEREQRPVSVLLIDIDYFKRVNDRYGHLAGDQALRAVADCLKEELRGYDSVGRFGGEEFVVCLPGVAGEQAGQIAERVRHQISVLEIPLLTSIPDDEGYLSVSIGLTQHNDGNSLDTLLQQADTALYAAKAAGRNRVIAACV